MATGGGGSMYYSSEAFYNFSCSICASDNKHSEGESYCLLSNEEDQKRSALKHNIMPNTTNFIKICA